MVPTILCDESVSNSCLNLMIFQNSMKQHQYYDSGKTKFLLTKKDTTI